MIKLCPPSYQTLPLSTGVSVGGGVYLVPGVDDMAAEDEGEADGEQGGPNHHSQ